MKVKDVRVLEEAHQDLDAGYQFYEQRERGVGAYFVASLIADIRSLRSYAGIHSIYLGYYKMLATKFPFAIYYEFGDDVARVVAVLDMRKNPATNLSALKERRNGPMSAEKGL
jgi:hypothetical protein